MRTLYVENNISNKISNLQLKLFKNIILTNKYFKSMP
jgi:hypothetical protein